VSSLTYFQVRPEYGMGRAFALTLAVHAILLLVMFLGVRWTVHDESPVTVELWDPPPPPPAPVVVEAPKPPPKVEPPKPEPEVKKPDIIVEKAPPKPKPKPVEVKPAPPKDDEFQKRLAREQLAMEQRKIDEDRRRADEQRRKAESERIGREQAASARNKALGDYVARIQQKVRQNWILPLDLQGNPEAIFEVVQLPTGEVLSAKLVKGSGNAAYDEAVYRAILKSSPLPVPASRELFSRVLKLTFRPRD
jgi:colicin import membrane protein